MIYLNFILFVKEFSFETNLSIILEINHLSLYWLENYLFLMKFISSLKT